MTDNETAPVGGGRIDPLDRLALSELMKASDARVITARSRAEKWIGALTAFTGLLGIVFVLKGPESVSDLQTGWKVAILLAFAIALTFLASATRRAYTAAFGSSSSPETTSPAPVEGLHDRLFEARRQAEASAKGNLSSAVLRAFIGIAFAAMGIGISWFATQEPAKAGEFTCIVDGKGAEVARFPGGTLEVTSLSGDAQVKSCT
jgi:hypothetical protein